jgi:hypothetical protein
MSDYLDEDGYPTEEALNKIADWSYRDIQGLIDFVSELWRFKEYSKVEANVWSLSTGGWSGNEDIIKALGNNRVFWLFCWESSQRGGHYVFDLSRVPKKGE